MPEHCTCGAQLPPESRFCHKCGKPQFDYPSIEEPEAVTVLPPVEAIAVPPEISFRNPLAVRIALFLSILTFLLMVILGPLIPLWMVVAGFLAVYLYRRRTGEAITAKGGARLGWIMGVFTFLIMMILTTILAVALSDSAVVDAVMAQMKQRGTEAAAQQVIDALRTPSGIISGLMGVFVMCASLPMVGGMLGATLLRRAS